MNEHPVPVRAPLKKEPYRHEQPRGMIPDLIHHGVTTDWLEHDNLWVPTPSGSFFKPVVFSPSEGLYINLIRVERSGVLSRHRHSGTVHAIVLKGRWQYLEHDWVAEEGSFVFEPPGETHTLYVPDGVDEMVTLFHVKAGYVFVDVDGNALGYEDVFTKMDKAREYYSSIGLGEDYINRFIR
ncbi:2,4'-dihydroxyacetophenone dioxygenase family protein [Bordetella sp. 02P26C-1]|uniref:2,4'-dihydroxyacetophenone dioxygenase family protein n=1 Tax=Bordetella sp. 02P26C-1 TaxID=2683195 RepID=UPI00192041C6|nr:2,4'-dihydroxyacetophenone dioxygenase family protein [Bordetella sp. 02P26C-1]